ncbi:MAG TPA: hypothetical protein VIN06_05540 [Devosia sp.]
MHATNILTSVTHLAPRTRADAFGKRLLLVNGLVLGTVAFVAGIIDLVGVFGGAGPLAQFVGQPVMVGMFEAHCLALLTSVLMLVHRRADGALWNLVGGIMHLVFFTANLMFWQFFVDTSAVPMGTAITAMHLVFLVLEFAAALWRRSEGRAL